MSSMASFAAEYTSAALFLENFPIFSVFLCKLPPKNGINGKIAYAGVVPASLPESSFIGKAAFLHDLAGVGIVHIVLGAYAVAVRICKKIGDHRPKSLTHYTLMPIVLADAVADLHGSDIFIYMHNAQAADGFSAFFPFDTPEVLGRVFITRFPLL